MVWSGTSGGGGWVGGWVAGFIETLDLCQLAWREEILVAIPPKEKKSESLLYFKKLL